MTDYDKFPGAVLCENCGQMLALHHAANYAEGPFVGVLVTICPTAVYKAPRRGDEHPKPSQAGQPGKSK